MVDSALQVMASACANHEEVSMLQAITENLSYPVFAEIRTKIDESILESTTYSKSAKAQRIQVSFGGRL
jgi:hypothetical protein